uniref:dolichyl-diphosphooligosaccharide--protein glycotransferase n=1 Tax=Lates calcarifer TaxID=8187 RepID=A0A4W6C7Z3_LATCA
MVEHHPVSDNKHKSSLNSGASYSGNGRSSIAVTERGSNGEGGGLSDGMSQPAGWQSLLSLNILFVAWVVGFSSRLFAVIRFESIIHEFDPWFNYRSTHLLTTSGFYEFLNWFDERAWYPLGRIVVGTVKSMRTGSVFWTIGCCLSYFYMVSAWGGYVFIINLISLHVFVLLLMQRFSRRVYIAYSAFYIIGLVLSMQIPFVGFQPIRTSEHMAAADLCRCVCATSGLRLPAVPEGPTDQTGVSDSVLPGSLTGCWSGFPLRHLSDIYRSLQYEAEWTASQRELIKPLIPVPMVSARGFSKHAQPS